MHANVILAVLLLAELAYAVLSSAVIPALPTLQRDLHTTETGVTWVLTGFLLSASVGTAITADSATCTARSGYCCRRSWSSGLDRCSRRSRPHFRS